jgi:NACHT domain
VLLNWTDIADLQIASAITAVAGMVARSRMSRRTTAVLVAAGWADTEALIRDGLPGARLEIPDMPDAEAAELEAAIQSHEVQGALQALLAARLTDAPEADAAEARRAVRLALTGAGLGAKPKRIDRRAIDSAVGGSVRFQTESVTARYAKQLSEHYDDKISALVARLEGRIGLERMRQIRAEAYSGRIVALLGAIERQVAALADPGRGGRAEAEWLSRYRRQARARHGYLYPPDFDRRRKFAVAAIYVNTPIVEFHDDQGTDRVYIRDADMIVASRPRIAARAADGPGLFVMDLASRMDRTVLLGDPGGGKTTAANVLANAFASDDSGPVPFLVTLREYAAQSPPERSVAEHVQHTLKTLYQSPAPDGLVERLLLTGRAAVIFDGLDELLDTSRRRDVSERVEQFCSAYPITPVLVTSRVVGYNQARLDDDQFSCYRLSGLGDAEAAEYVHKWFATQEQMPAAEASTKAKAFLAESEKARDLRANPLLLSLMCILYRGAGSLPGDRAGIYAECAKLLLRKWDEQRELYRKVSYDHLVEQAIRHLAWWLFTRADGGRAQATERELAARTAEFLHGRAFESAEEANAAAREFVEFCRGRMWVFSDAGTTAGGEKLYDFTHRTFLEYFAACHLAATSDTPEDLARSLAPRLRDRGWEVVGELAIKIKADAIDRGADRIYAALLDHATDETAENLSRGVAWDRFNLMRFLAHCLTSAKPSPGTARGLANSAVDWILDEGMSADGLGSLGLFIEESGDCQELIADAMSTSIGRLVDSGDPARRIAALLLVLKFAKSRQLSAGTWQRWFNETIRRHAADIATDAAVDVELRTEALYADFISVKEALAMPGGLGTLILRPPHRFLVEEHSAYATFLCSMLLRDQPGDDTSTGASAAYLRKLNAVGQHLSDHPATPWVLAARSCDSPDEGSYLVQRLRQTRDRRRPVSDVTALGLAAVICAAEETTTRPRPDRLYDPHPELTGLAGLLYRYVVRRATGMPDNLPDLPVPERFRQVFRDWAEGRVDFVEVLEE